MSSGEMEPTTILIPMILSAFHLSPTVPDIKNPYYLAPITQPDYTGMRLDPANISHDLLTHIDLTFTTPAEANTRIYDIDKQELRRNRIGIVLHWSLPKVFRWGTNATETGKDRATGNLTSASPENMSNPCFRTPPNRWLIVRHADMDTIIPETAKESFPEFDAWVVESDRIRHISELDIDVDLETDVVPFINTAALIPCGDKDHAGHPIDIHGETFLGYRERAQSWKEDESAIRVDLGVLTSSNPFFADYQPHCSNVFSLTDTFEYTLEGKEEKHYLEKVNAAYHVVGWHSDPTKDLFADFKTEGATLSSLFTAFGLQASLPPLQNADDWQKLLADTLPAAMKPRSLTVGRMYNVCWNFASCPPHPNSIAERFTEIAPIAVSTIPACGVKIFQDALPLRSKPPPRDKPNPKEFWLEITEQAILHAGSISRNAGITELYQAKDSVEATSMWDHEAGGSRWKVSALDNATGDLDSALGKEAGGKNFAALVSDHHKTLLCRGAMEAESDKLSPLEILEDANVLQRHFDILARRKKHYQSLLFGEWWKRIAIKDAEKSTSESLISTIEELNRALVSVHNQILAKIKALATDHKVPCKQASTGRFHTPKEPTLLVAGIPNPWPWDYSQPLPVRLHSQVVESTLPDNSSLWPSFEQFANTLDEKKFLSSDFHPDVGLQIFREFEILRIVNSNVSLNNVKLSVKSPANGTFPHYYCDIPADPILPPKTGAFQIVTPAQETAEDLYIGVGLSANVGDVHPAAVFVALPNRPYDIYPVNKYYIVAGGDHERGQIIGDTGARDKVLVDLTTSDLRFVEHRKEGGFSVS